MRAYAIHRPIGPFTWPSEHRDKVVEIVNFDKRMPVEELGGRWAFGYIDFREDVPREDLARYELEVPKERDEFLEKVARIVALHIERGQFERAERDLELARDKYGYDHETVMDLVAERLG